MKKILILLAVATLPMAAARLLRRRWPAVPVLPVQLVQPPGDRACPPTLCCSAGGRAVCSGCPPPCAGCARRPVRPTCTVRRWRRPMMPQYMAPQAMPMMPQAQPMYYQSPCRQCCGAAVPTAVPQPCGDYAEAGGGYVEPGCGGPYMGNVATAR